ncbi:hypothetical protein MHBO_001055 [Bonamia ostreae]|uniref:Uncharacterized protein n=1 Tax=Bonamia ostreae TaxID=126728 RepID=A0ABV2AIW8_9EUKA
MLRNEKKLNIERMQWLCMKIQKNVNLYQPNAEDRFNIAEANNYNLLYSNLKFLAKDDCERVDADKMQNTLDNLLSIPTFSPYSGTLVAPVPTKFKEVVSQAHSQNLFVEYSLFGAKKRAQTISDALSVLGVYISAFIIQQAVCSLFLSLEIRTITNWRIVQTAGMLITYCLCMGVALAGYLGQKDIIGETVFDKMKIRYFIDTGQIDYGFNSPFLVVNAGRIALCVTIALTFPMMFFYAKKNVLLILFALLDVIWGIKANKERPEAKYFYPVTVGLFVLVLIFGLFVDKIIVVFSVIGTLLAAPIIYVLLVKVRLYRSSVTSDQRADFQIT